MTSFFVQSGYDGRWRRGGGGKKLRFLDDVICERPLRVKNKIQSRSKMRKNEKLC